ncbi:MAG: hypothetical protein WCT13_03445 [Patescibacteria group bacterium]|jgi:hypothetical protein
MPHHCHSGDQPELFPAVAQPPEKEIFRWEIRVRSGETFMVNGATLREAIADVGRAQGLTGQPETVYRNALRLYKPEFVSKTAVRFLE